MVVNPQGIQTELIQKPVYARQLDGYVRLQSNSEGIPDVRVEECDAGWKNVLSSTITDKQGHFHLKPGVNGPTHYLRLTALGFNLRMYTVKLSSHAPSELDLRITVAT